jgi:hypothetical protein
MPLWAIMKEPDMALYIKAKKVEVIEEDRDGVAGFLISEDTGERWQDAESFLAGHVLYSDDDAEGIEIDLDD